MHSFANTYQDHVLWYSLHTLSEDQVLAFAWYVTEEPKFMSESRNQAGAFYLLPDTFLYLTEEKCLQSGDQFSILQILTIFQCYLHQSV